MAYIGASPIRCSIAVGDYCYRRAFCLSHVQRSCSEVEQHVANTCLICKLPCNLLLLKTLRGSR